MNPYKKCAAKQYSLDNPLRRSNPPEVFLGKSAPKISRRTLQSNFIEITLRRGFLL